MKRKQMPVGRIMPCPLEWCETGPLPRPASRPPDTAATLQTLDHLRDAGRAHRACVLGQRRGCPAARLLAVGRSLLYPSFQPFDERHRFLFSWLSERILRHPYGKF